MGETACIMLGGELRALREAAKISTDAAATALSWYRAKVSKVETGPVLAGTDGQWNAFIEDLSPGLPIC